MEEFSKFKLKKKINHTSLYTIDKLSLKKENIFKISEGIKINSEILKKNKTTFNSKLQRYIQRKRKHIFHMYNIYYKIINCNKRYR